MQKRKIPLPSRLLKGLVKLFTKKTEFIHLGDKPTGKDIILSNHVGTSAPLAFEFYYDKDVTFWGAYEMNGSLKELYKYHTKVYFHEKKHWNIHLARLYCLIASPLTYIFYRGINLIPTYRDSRSKNTLRLSLKALENDETILIFPEDSTNGYLDELEGFHLGFYALCEYAFKNNIDVPIYVSYYQKKNKIYIIDKPIMYSALVSEGLTKEEMARKLCARCNELGKMNIDEFNK